MKYATIVIDHFIKWVEAEPLATIIEKRITTFVTQSLINQFGIPCILIMDNEKQFHNANFKEFCVNLSIDLRFVSPAHPEANR